MLNPASPSGPAAAPWSAIWRRARGLVVMGRFLALLGGATLVVVLLREGASLVVLGGRRTTADVYFVQPLTAYRVRVYYTLPTRVGSSRFLAELPRGYAAGDALPAFVDPAAPGRHVLLARWADAQPGIVMLAAMTAFSLALLGLGRAIHRGQPDLPEARRQTAVAVLCAAATLGGFAWAVWSRGDASLLRDGVLVIPFVLYRIYAAARHPPLAYRILARTASSPAEAAQLRAMAGG
jgi:hypothetical protein